jgi:hypothetical protein
VPCVALRTPALCAEWTCPRVLACSLLAPSPLSNSFELAEAAKAQIHRSSINASQEARELGLFATGIHFLEV